MFSSLFNFLYELLCGENADIPDYVDGIFENVGILTVLLVLVSVILFYLVLGRISNIWHTALHWIITIVVTMVLSSILAFMVAKSQLGLVDPYLIKFSLMNLILSGVYFIVFSVLLKQFSIYAKRSPF